MGAFGKQICRALPLAGRGAVSEAVGSDWRTALEAGRFDEAYRLHLLLADGTPEVRRALAALADVQELVREKSWARARRRLERLEERPQLLDWSELDSELERLEASARSLEQVQLEEARERLEPLQGGWFQAEVANQRGTAYVYSGDLEEAKSEFGDALERDPRHYRALTNLGNAHLEAGEIDEAIACYKRAIELNEEFAGAHHNLGVAYRRQGRVGQSVRQLRRAQRVVQRSERDRARQSLGSGGSGAGLKVLRWTLYGLVALTLYALLRNGGLI